MSLPETSPGHKPQQSVKKPVLCVTPLAPDQAAPAPAPATTTHSPCQPEKRVTAAGKQDEKHKRKSVEIMS